MKTSIKQFLDDLYEIDPTLKAHQVDLVPLLEKLLANDPGVAPDAAFVSSLRIQLNENAARMRAPEHSSMWQKFFYAFGGALTAAVIIPLAIIATNQHPLSPQAPLFSNSVQATSKNAFGSLNDMVPVGAGAPSAAANMAPNPTFERTQSDGGGVGGGGGIPPANPTVSAVAPADMAMGKMIAPWPMIEYNYVLSEPLTDLEANVDVYKKTPATARSLSLSAIASSLNFGGIDVASFSGMTVENLTFTQKTPFGYMLNSSMRDGTVSIDANWEQWPQSKCQTDACYQAERVKIGDIASDDVYIALAKDFAADHGIDLSSYGAAEVDNAWKRDYERTEDKKNAYVPDIQRVIFPQIIDGKPVYDQSGIKTGLSISVNVKHKKVMSVWGIMDRSYVKSAYAGVTDKTAIEKYLDAMGGGYPHIMMDYVRTAPAGEKPETQKVKVTLGKPTLSYVQYYRYTNNTNEELLIPSLIFPIEKTEGGKDAIYYPTQVVVPLAKDMLEEQGGNRPIPMMKGGVMMEDAVAPAMPVPTPAVAPMPTPTE